MSSEVYKRLPKDIDEGIHLDLLKYYLKRRVTIQKEIKLRS